jgi:hypothetical protein
MTPLLCEGVGLHTLPFLFTVVWCFNLCQGDLEKIGSISPREQTVRNFESDTIIALHHFFIFIFTVQQYIIHHARTK